MMLVLRSTASLPTCLFEAVDTLRDHIFSELRWTAKRVDLSRSEKVDSEAVDQCAIFWLETQYLKILTKIFNIVPCINKYRLYLCTIHSK